MPLLDRTARQAQLTDEGLALAKVLRGSFEAISAQVTQMTTKDAAPFGRFHDTEFRGELVGAKTCGVSCETSRGECCD